MIMFRAVFVLLAVAALAVIEASPAVAEIYSPWCVQYTGGNGDNGTTCAFNSFEQCMLTARGSGGHCEQNQWYLRYGSGQQRPDSTDQGKRPRRR